MTNTYRQKVIAFRKEKDQDIRRENSWLALAGLTWLNEGKNMAGSDSTCDIQLPPRAPATLGVFEFDGKTVSFQSAQQNGVEINGVPVMRAVLKSSKDPSPSFIAFDHMRMVIHEHNGGFGVRVWDNERPERRDHPPRKWFRINEKYRLLADFARFEEPVKALLPNVLGDVEEWDITGQVTFNLHGKSFTLDTTDSKQNRLFIQFRDLTSRTKTYPAGRYLYTEVVQDNKVVVDFNFAHNPPCVFTPYATCAFAPERNRLDFNVSAGEMYQHGR